MRLGWVALPCLIALQACSPLRKYQEAARSLRFSLDRVEPSFHLAYPPSHSRLAFRITLGVENPSTVPFHLKDFHGDLRLDSPNGPITLGHLELQRAVDLPAGGHASLDLEASFLYHTLQEHWVPLQAALRGDAPGAWELAGELKIEAFAIPWQHPIKVRRAFGSAP